MKEKSQESYHHLISVLTKANRAVQSVVKIECISCKMNRCRSEVYVELGQAQYDNNGLAIIKIDQQSSISIQSTLSQLMAKTSP